MKLVKELRGFPSRHQMSQLFFQFVMQKFRHLTGLLTVSWSKPIHTKNGIVLQHQSGTQKKRKQLKKQLEKISKRKSRIYSESAFQILIKCLQAIALKPFVLTMPELLCPTFFQTLPFKNHSRKSILDFVPSSEF